MSLSVTTTDGQQREFGLTPNQDGGFDLRLPDGAVIPEREVSALLRWFSAGGDCGRPTRRPAEEVIFFRDGKLAVLADGQQVVREQNDTAWDVVLSDLFLRGVVAPWTLVRTPSDEPRHVDTFRIPR